MKYLKKIQYNSPVILSFALLSFFSLVLGYITNDMTTNLFFCVYRSSLLDPFSWIRLVGHVLGHSNLEHFCNNMLLFLLVGPILEEKYGSKPILIMILCTAVITGMVNIIFTSNGLLGASGIVFMMIVLSSMTSVKEGKIPLTLIIIVLIYIGQEVVASFTMHDNVSRITHIIGGICGIVFGFMFEKKKNGSSFDDEEPEYVKNRKIL